MKEWKQPEMLDLRIALTAGACGKRPGNGFGKKPGHSDHVLPTPIPTLPPSLVIDESEITL